MGNRSKYLERINVLDREVFSQAKGGIVLFNV
jgi:hypothetical protein